MKISVILPVYNGENYIRTALESVISQKGDFEIELIVVNDGSEDGTQDIIKRFGSQYSNLKIIDQENRGLSAARNAGLDAATGDWLVFLDADDLLPDSSLDFLCNLVRKKKCDVGTGRIIRKKSFLKGKTFSRKFDEKTIGNKEVILKMFYQTDSRINCSACGKIFKKELFDNLRFPEGLYYEDLALVPILISQCEKIAVSSRPVYYYRNNPFSFLNSWTENRADSLKVLKEHLHRKEFERDAEIHAALTDRLLSASFNLLNAMKKYGIENKSIESECREIIKTYRQTSLANRDVRLKNKLGILLSYFQKNW